MSKIYEPHKIKNSIRAAQADTAAPTAIGNQSMEALMSGQTAPSRQNMGQKVDLPEAIRAKMENSFGADLSGVEVYKSQAVADAGAEAITMGSKIAFAPGKLDFASSGGQALLGHELSHVVSQARGEVTGSGFLSDHALEARADREGAMAAAGEQVYSGPVTPLSTSSVSASAGPMQASKSKRSQDANQKKWVNGVSPSVRYLKQLNDFEKLSERQKKKYVEKQREIGTERFQKWDESHRAEGEEHSAGYNAAQDYSDNILYPIINTKLRTDQFPTDVRGFKVNTRRKNQAMKAATDLQESLTTGEHTELEEDTIVHRGAGSYGQVLNSQLPTPVADENLTAALAGNIFTEKAFTSTSIDPQVATRFSGIDDPKKVNDEHNLIHAVLPAGYKAQYMEGASLAKSEKEMVLPQNAMLRVIEAKDKTRKKDGKQYREIKGAYIRGNTIIGNHRKKKQDP